MTWSGNLFILLITIPDSHENVLPPLHIGIEREANADNRHEDGKPTDRVYLAVEGVLGGPQGVAWREEVSRRVGGGQHCAL
jgi:hypothetical protein